MRQDKRKSGLAQRVGTKLHLQGKIIRFGFHKKRPDKPETYVLVSDLVEVHTNCKVADHVWIKFGKKFESTDIDRGDTITFFAIVGSYMKKTRSIMSYRLNYPSRVAIVGHDDKMVRQRFPERDKVRMIDRAKIISLGDS